MERKAKIILTEGSEELASLQPSKTVDTRGMICPYPSLMTVKALKDLKPGDVLEVLTDSDVSAKESIPTVLQQRGYRYVVLEEKDYWIIRAKKD